MVRRVAVLVAALVAMALVAVPAYGKERGVRSALAYSMPNTVITNDKTGKCLTIAGGTSAANNVHAVQYDCDRDSSRHWDIYPYGGGVQIRNVKTRKCLTIAGGTSSANNLVAVQYDCDADPSRQWYLVGSGGDFQIQNVKTGKCLTIAGGTSSANNLEAVQYDCDADPSRRWTVPGPGSADLLKNVKTGKCLTVADASVENNAHLIQYDCVPGQSLKWRVELQPDGNVQVFNNLSGKCATPAGGRSTANNLVIVQYDCDTDPSRRWVLVGATFAQAQHGDVPFGLQNLQTGKCLTIAGGTSSANNLEAVQYNCDTDPSRRWTISGS